MISVEALADLPSGRVHKWAWELFFEVLKRFNNARRIETRFLIDLAMVQPPSALANSSKQYSCFGAIYKCCT